MVVIINRPSLKPYGLTVEKWIPKLMPRPDRHNEIEINLLTSGTLTYLINDKKIIIPPKQIAVFWALVPHQIIHFENKAPYYVCTIPFSQFMDWRLPFSFVNHILNGDVVNAVSGNAYQYDKHSLENWLWDISTGDQEYLNVVTLEIHAWLNRLALNYKPIEWHASKEKECSSHMNTLVEKMIVFIARNYTHSLKIKDVADSVGLSPDYANTLFKKYFGMTLNQYILKQRLLHAKRQLSVSKTSITEIAYEAGFNSVSRFNNAFKKSCKCSPREYRKKHSFFNGL